jgi:hypothetical protein
MDCHLEQGTKALAQRDQLFRRRSGVSVVQRVQGIPDDGGGCLVLSPEHHRLEVHGPGVLEQVRSAVVAEESHRTLSIPAT